MPVGVYEKVYNSKNFLSLYPTIWADSKVVKVIPHEDFTLSVWFKNTGERLFDFKPLLEYSFYSGLKDLELFMKAKVDSNGVYWNDDFDIAPEWLYIDSDPV